MNEHSNVCPQERRVVNRRTEQTKWRKDPLWLKMLEDHAHTPEAECVHCRRHHRQVSTDRDGEVKYNKKGKEKIITLTINHISRHEYNDKELFLTWNEYKEVCCNVCNWMFEKGKKPCPDCLKKGVVSYIMWYEEECYPCYLEKHPDVLARINQTRIDQKHQLREIKDKKNAKNRAAKRAHPCRFHGYSQKCRFRPGTICPHSPTKAEKNCVDFERKKCAVNVKPQSIK
jgi:hypothetical protein